MNGLAAAALLAGGLLLLLLLLIPCRASSKSVISWTAESCGTASIRVKHVSDLGSLLLSVTPTLHWNSTP